ncbi:MAG TPA: hypothetical protein VHK24_06885, partial [Steroidobacter sp.]|nr:hypothetical protein [Steroidobacter sp.]
SPASRMAAIFDVSGLEAAVSDLIFRQDGPFLALLARAGSARIARWALVRRRESSDRLEQLTGNSGRSWTC